MTRNLIHTWNLKTVKPLSETLDSHDRPVVYTTYPGAAKIKSPYYLAAKLFARAGNLDRLLNGKAKDYLDEELWPLVDVVKADRENFAALDEQSRLTYCRDILNGIVASA
mgnify:CR=1 FL=1